MHIHSTIKLSILCTFVLIVVACSTPNIEITPQGYTSAPTALLVEGNVNPINVHRSQPALSWLAGVKKQRAFQIQVASSESGLLNDNTDLWDSGKVEGQSSRNIAYGGQPLNKNDIAFWRVRVWQEGSETPQLWSTISRWEMGLLSIDDWQAKWLQAAVPKVVDSTAAISHWVNLVGTVENEDGSIGTPAIEKLHSMPTASLFRYEFTTNKVIESAKLHSTAGGYYEIFINGKKVKDRLMDPGQTDFDKRILYNTDEVSQFITQGENVIAVHLGSGWYDENIAFSRWKNPDGDYATRDRGSYTFGQPTFIAQLDLRFTDGSTSSVYSNENWVSHPSPIVKEGIFSGEVFDANKAIKDWHSISHSNSHNNSQWEAVKVLETWPTQSMQPQLLPPIRAVKEMRPVALLNPSEGVWVFDFGQNFTGLPSVNLDMLSLAPGQGLYLRFAEWADAKGNISQLSGGSWATHLNAVNAYIASENNEGSWTPSFSWHGFRYIEVTGLNEAPSLDLITANLIRSDVERVGHFESSDPLLNRIHNTALWTYESNLMSVPLDCPIREKAGWTGDAHAALITGNYNFNMQTFWPKYLGDFKTSINIAPTVVPGKRTGAKKVDWAVAEVFIAWEHYRHHGDIQVLKDQYQSLLEYMEFGQTQMRDFLISTGYGDWCDPVIAPGTPRVGGRGTPQWTSTTVTSTALFTQAANYMSKIAQVLGKPNDQETFTTLHNNLKEGFHRALYDEQSGHYGSQTADAMALRFEITPVALRQSVADALNKDVVEKWKGHSSVGALGQTWLYLALSDYGYADTAFNIFKAQGYPGFSYLFDELGGTTLWERKGAFDPNTGRGPLRSLNHPFHSGYDGWFYQGLGGIRPLENSVGFQEFMLKPAFPKGLNEVDTRYDSGYGVIASVWQRKGTEIHWRITIPNNTRAWVALPDREMQLYSAGKYEFRIPQ
ncbi:family 78 glycoside hydrolase catalytic domain [Glaciecola sp. SC05]|uniref:family 78 glycoside hydrolase catalytic domain n=1 Tax=Glaciecola sp. SC05 TaxID=1987355 RepID=UPI0035299262